MTSMAWSMLFKSSTAKTLAMSNPSAPADQFAAVMQQLSAEAKKSQSARPSTVPETPAQSLDARLQNLEDALCRKIDDLARSMIQIRSQDLPGQFHNIEEQLTAIRNSESVNQRLFDSLHDELLKYRDNFVHESLQKPFIHDLIHLFDDLSSLAGQLANSGKDRKKLGHIAQWGDNLENAVHALVEILHRLDVREIEPKETVDRTVHKVINYEPADYAEDDGRIVMRLKRGFLWRDQLIRPEEVIAKRFG
jgi:molecular chaperone GrpE (heat shock protein)